MRFWAQPHEHQYPTLRVEKVTVWCMLRRNGIIALYWSEDTDGRPVTLNTEGCIELSEKKMHSGSEADARSGHGH